MTCCFIGHRQINNQKDIEIALYKVIISLIESGADVFLLGSRGQFNDLAYKTLKSIRLKTDYSYSIVYVRAEYPYADDNYCTNLLNYYDDVIMPDQVKKAGKLAYILRNYYMIDNSDIVVVHLSDICNKHSGTKIAFDYANKKKKQIINICSLT